MSELFLINGRLNTQDPANPEVSAVAMRDGRFVAVGSDEQVLSLATPESHVIDLDDRRVLPGLTDAHVHFYDWALGRQNLVLEDLPSLECFVEKLGQFARQLAPNRWILGYRWNASEWPENRLPERSDLDCVTGEHPAILWHTSLHMAVVNTRALQFAGITAQTPNPPQGIIDRDACGEPTGVLRDLAMNLVSGKLPPPDEDETISAFKEGFEFFYRLGLTGVQDQRLMGAPEGPAAFRIWQRMQRAGEIGLRVWMNLPGESVDEIIALGLRTGLGDDTFRIGHLKYFSDGAQGSKTAWMLEPYEGTQETGLQLTPIEEIAESIRKAQAAGLAVAVHAIGDRANRELISAFEGLASNGLTPLSAPPLAPHRIEHVQIIRPEDVKRLSRLGVVASVQPISVVDDISMMEPTIGARSRFAYPFRSMWEAGVPLVFSSDCPVSNPNPFWGIHAAVTRRRQDGTPSGGWYPEECLTVDQAVWAFSMGAALVSGRQDELGSITPGKLADLVVLDRDIFAIDPMEIPQTKPVITVFDGKIVYEASG